MGVFFILIVAIILFVIIKFAGATNKQSNEVRSQGGMKVKYMILYEFFMSSHGENKLIKETNTYLCIGHSNYGGSSVFHLQQTFGEITIQFEFNNPVFGKHKLEWSFNEKMNQYKMIEKIENDTNDFMMNYAKKFS